MKAIVILVGLIVTAAAFGEWAVDGNVKVFSGGEGIRVTVVPLKPKKDKKVVLYVEGTDTEIDGKPILHSVRESGTKADFVRKNRGQDWVTMAARESWYSSRTYYLFVPGRQSDVPVSYDEKKSETAKPDEILAKLLLRKAPPSSFDKKAEQEKEEKRFQELLGQASGTCGSPLSGKIDWATINDDALKALQVGEACGAAAAGVEAVCDDDVGKETIKKKIKSVTCKLGSKPEVALSSGTLSWTTAKETPDQIALVREWLENKL